VLLIVEVKSRNQRISEFFSPTEAVDERKEKKLRALARWYIQHNAIALKRRRIRRLRFDTIAITAKIQFKTWRLSALNWVQGQEEPLELQSITDLSLL
jgi:Holliday junction resolvase-like predicted endonuclease